MVTNSKVIRKLIKSAAQKTISILSIRKFIKKAIDFLKSLPKSIE
jgi:hypothetical protein